MGGQGSARGTRWLRRVLVSLGVVTALVVVGAVVVVTVPALRTRLLEYLGAGQGAATGAESVPVREIRRGQRPRSADAFVDSIGVNTHLHFRDSSYARFDDLVRPRLRELGVRHVRDGALPAAGTSPGESFYEEVARLADDGIDFQLIVSPRSDGTVDRDLLAGVLDVGGGAISALEGPNEPDLSGFADWPGVTRSVTRSTRELLAAYAAGPGADVPEVVLPSVTTSEAAAELGDLSADGDVANLHPYYAGRQPETAGFGDDGYGSLPWNDREVADVIGPGLPIMGTETGYYSARGGEYWVSPQAKATYVPRLLMYHFANGVDRTYLYELLDQFDDPDDPQDDFGLVESDGTPKAAFLALRDLIDVLEDPGPRFTTTPVDVTVDAGPDIAQVLVQKRDGRTYVVLWNTRPVWDVITHEPLRVRDQQVDVGVPDGYAVSRVVRLADDGPAVDQPVPAPGPRARIAAGATLTLVELTPGPA